MRIGSLQLSNPFFLAPMEAVNCSSFRLLCEKRGASLVYTDMIDADVFFDYAKKTSVSKAVKRYVNYNKENLAVQLGGRDVNNLLFTYNAVKDFAKLIDYNIGCPLSYMLAKKGGVYLMKHPDQLFKIVSELRKEISLPFTVKMRKGWDDYNINALEICQELEKLGVDAVTIHARTRKQRYQDRADWPYVRTIKEKLSIPVILSGDVTNSYMAHMAFAHTKCDFIMIGRGAQRNPSIFLDLKKVSTKIKPNKPLTVYDKKTKYVISDFKEFLSLYNKLEAKYSIKQLKDYALWFTTECKNNRFVTQKILAAKNEKELLAIVQNTSY